MSIMNFERLDGYYDGSGHWQRTKFCHVFCGSRCTCQPPFGLYYSPERDKRTVWGYFMRPAESDTELLDWAANHPDIVMRELTKWWAVSGPRWREIFHFRTIMQIAYRKHTTESEV